MLSSPCDNCGLCCLNTEMILSKKDCETILENGQELQAIHDFAFLNEEGFYQLKNIDEHCVFFNIDQKKCEIYEYRPMGCRFYPMIFDLSLRKCDLDEECPNKEHIYPSKKDMLTICRQLIAFLKKELNIKTD